MLPDGIIVYGSLLNKTELQDVFPTASYTPVRLVGFNRSYNQSATWRTGDDGERGTLTANFDPFSYINAVLVTEFTASEYEDYTDREQGYELCSFSPDRIHLYDKTELEIHNPIISIGKLWLNAVTPIPEYVQLCEKGAEQWGEVFAKEFTQTTHETVSFPENPMCIRTSGFDEPQFSSLERQ